MRIINDIIITIVMFCDYRYYYCCYYYHCYFLFAASYLSLLFLLLSFLISAELEVEGDLKVTGNIQAGTIDSLQQIIADLQVQIALLQAADNKLETSRYHLSA